MSTGAFLREAEEQYAIVQDETSGMWRILDTWHKDLKQLDPDDEIPDTHPAVKTLSQGQFFALLKQARKEGVIPEFSTFPPSAGPSKYAYEEIVKERNALKIELDTLKSLSRGGPKSASQEAMDYIFRLAMGNEITRIRSSNN